MIEDIIEKAIGVDLDRLEEDIEEETNMPHFDDINEVDIIEVWSVTDAIKKLLRRRYRFMD